MEIELKYKASKEQAEKIIPSDAREIKNFATYYDSKKNGLREIKVSIRCRRENDEYVATVKWGGGSNKGLHKRGELNVIVDQAWQEKPDPTVFYECPEYDKIAEALGGEYSNEWGELVPRERLLPIIEMSFVRMEWDVDLPDGGKGVMSYDNGAIMANGCHEDISEVEIELSEGTEEELLAFGKEIETKYKLIPFSKSKYKRGLVLISKEKA